MEPKYRQQLVQKFRPELGETPLRVLHIPDEFGFMDAELIELIEKAVSPIVEGFGEGGAL